MYFTRDVRVTATYEQQHVFRMLPRQRRGRPSRNQPYHVGEGERWEKKCVGADLRSTRIVVFLAEFFLFVCFILFGFFVLLACFE